jgi:hypothetical protein
MSFFDDASLVMIPSGYKDQKVYSVKPLDGSGDLTFSRASNATRVASNGLIEKVRTNLVLQSNTFSTTWINSDSNETSGQAGYDGTNNAWLLTTTLSGGFIQQSVAINGLTTFSAYAKAGTQNGIILYSVHVAQGINFNLSTGVVGAAFVAAPLGSRIESIGNGWYRCSITVSSSSTNNFRIYVSDGSNPSLGNALIQNAQVETGDIATDYIPTTTAAVSVGPVSGLPRLDYLNSTCPRLLLEPQRTNVVTFSENFDNAAYTKGQCSITANAATAPDGTLSADKLVENTSNDAHVVYRNPGGADATFSFFAKAAGRNWVGVLSNNGNISFFNIGNGTLGTIQSGSTATITSYGNGWYRCTLFNTHSSFGVSIYLATANGTETYTGDGTSGAYIWGAQLEASSTYATSYIPTTTASVTRVADAASKTGISSLIGQTEGTIYAEFTVGGAGDRVMAAKGGDNRFAINASPTEIGALIVTFAGGVVYNAVASFTHGATTKVAFAYKSGESVLYVNGSAVLTTTVTFAFNSSISELYLAQREFSPGTGQTGQRHSQALVFKTRLTNAQLAELTTL